MYRRGPSRATPANVQCQKCLKRARHYSYECKGTTQDRPYVARPSRTQQLLNPKLVPKLSSETPNALEKKKGVADEELAKREAERARKRELERDEDDSDEDGPSRRRRSDSRDSGSSASITAPRSPDFPAQGRGSSRSPLRTAKKHETSSPPAGRGPRGNSHSSDEDDSREPKQGYQSRSLSPEARRPERPRSPLRDAGSPRTRYSTRSVSPDDGPAYERRRRYSSSPSRSPPPENQRRSFRSRSPAPQGARGRSPPRHRDNRDEERGGHREPRDRGRGAPQRREQQRERSLSPFSKRLALTQSMNMGR